MKAATLKLCYISSTVYIHHCMFLLQLALLLLLLISFVISIFSENEKIESNECLSNEETYRSLARASKSIKRHGSNIKKELDNKIESLKKPEDESENLEENEIIFNESEEKQLTLNLTEREVQEEYNLKPGLNEAEFSVTTQYQGKLFFINCSWLLFTISFTFNIFKIIDFL